MCSFFLFFQRDIDWAANEGWVLTNLGQRGHKDPESNDEWDLDALEINVEHLVLVLRVPLVRRLVVTQPRVADMVLGEETN